MSGIEINQMLATMRLMQAQAQQKEAVGNTQPAGFDFAQLLKQSIDNVNGLQQHSSGLQEAYASGDSTVSLSDVMIASH